MDDTRAALVKELAGRQARESEQRIDDADLQDLIVKYRKARPELESRGPAARTRLRRADDMLAGSALSDRDKKRVILRLLGGAVKDAGVVRDSGRFGLKSCSELRAELDAARGDIAINGPDTLRDLLTATDDLLRRKPKWTTCQKASRYKTLLMMYRSTRRSEKAGTTFDLVVPLKMSGSMHDNAELRYLLRSADRHLAGLRRVHVVADGPCPWWFRQGGDAMWHNVPRAPGVGKNKDIVDRFLFAARCEDVSEHFVGCCDDFLILRDLNMAGDDGYAATQLGGQLSRSRSTGAWNSAQADTAQALEAAGFPTMYYDYHVPTMMTKSGWVDVDDYVDWVSVEGHGVWSLYHNVAGVHGRVECTKTYGGYHSSGMGAVPDSPVQIERDSAGCLFFNYNDIGLSNGVMLEWLEARFPDKSRFETPDLPHVTVAFVLLSGGHYSQCHVRWLCGQIDRTMLNPHRFVCLSDVPVDGADVIPLTGELRWHWAKLELFREDVFDQDEIVMYTDLDNVWHGKFAVPDPGDDIYMCNEHGAFEGKRITWNSSVMLWKGHRPEPYLRALEVQRSGENLRDHFPGDQECIASGNFYARTPPKDIGAIAPVKFSNQAEARLPEPPAGTACTIMYCGGPRPWGVDAPRWVASMYTGDDTVTDDVGMVMCHWGRDGRGIDAAIAGMRRTMELLEPSPAHSVMVESLPDGADSALEPVCAELGISYVRHRETTRHRGVWKKETLWNMGARWLESQHADMVGFVFLDADTHPTSGDWFARVCDQIIYDGVDFMQPWTDSVDSETGRRKPSRAFAGADGNPGRCWAVGRRFFDAIGGLPVLPESTADSVTVAALVEGSPPNEKSLKLAWYNNAVRRIMEIAGHRRPSRCIPETLVHVGHGDKLFGYFDDRNALVAEFCDDMDDLIELDDDGVAMLAEGSVPAAWRAAREKLDPSRRYSDREISSLGRGGPVHTYRSLRGYFDWENCYDEIVATAPYGSSVVELGVLFGKSTVYLAVESELSGKNLNITAIDRFLYEDSVKGEVGSVEMEARRNIASCGVPVTIVVGDQHDEHARFENESLWAVWLDTDHGEDSTRRALEEWWVKVMPGGYFGGHDYKDPNWEGVGVAVDAWAAENGLAVEVRGKSFMVRKPTRA